MNLALIYGMSFMGLIDKMRLETNQVGVDAFPHTLQITLKVYDIVELAWNERLHENLRIPAESRM